MGSLKGKSISKSYQRILQTPSEISNTTLKSVETGSGNATSMSLSTDKAEFLKVGIGTGGAQPDGLLHVLSASAGSVTSSSFANQITIENSGDSGLSILSGATGSGNIYFGDVNDNDVGKIVYDHSDNVMVFGTSGSDKMRLDQQGNLNISGTLSQSDDRFDLIERFEKAPTLGITDAIVTQSSSATTAVTLNAKYGIITMQAVDLAATDSVEFTFNNTFIYGTTSQVLVNIYNGGTIADNAIINIMTHDVADGSCKIRLATNATDVVSQTFKIYFIVDPYIIPNQNFVIGGANAGTLQSSSNVKRDVSFAGIKLNTGTTDNDTTIITPRDGETESPPGADSSAWAAVGFGTENKVEFKTAVSTSSTITDMSFWAGLKLTEVGAYATDANQAYFLWATNDDQGALTTNGNLHFVYSVAGTDYITDLGITITASTVYRLRIIFDEGRRISVFVNNTQYGLVTTATAGGATQSVASTKSLAMTDDIDFLSFIGVQTLTTASRIIQVGYIKLSRDLYE